MKLTEAQKKVSTSPAFWENIERSKKQVEYWQKHPLSLEEIDEMMARRKDFLAHSR